MASRTPNRDLAGPLYGKDPWPLRFHSHDFDAICFNTLECSILYNRRQFGTRTIDRDGVVTDGPSGTPPFERWRDQWTGNDVIVPSEGRTFPSPVVIEWLSIDGVMHTANLDLDELFAERLILHRVRRDEVKEPWLDAKTVNPVRPDILVEVNDRTVNIFMRALVATAATPPGNEQGDLRDDLMLAWTHTY
jgi:hypothetical protein